jgi:hypothetical protein
MIDPIKPIGAFIENTIRPLLQEFRWFFDECEKHHLKITEQNIKAVADYVARAHMRTVVIQCVQAIFIALIVCITFLVLR